MLLETSMAVNAFQHSSLRSLWKRIYEESMNRLTQQLSHSRTQSGGHQTQLPRAKHAAAERPRARRHHIVVALATIGRARGDRHCARVVVVVVGGAVSVCDIGVAEHLVLGLRVWVRSSVPARDHRAALGNVVQLSVGDRSLRAPGARALLGRAVSSREL